MTVEFRTDRRMHADVVLRQAQDWESRSYVMELNASFQESWER